MTSCSYSYQQEKLSTIILTSWNDELLSGKLGDNDGAIFYRLATLMFLESHPQTTETFHSGSEPIPKKKVDRNSNSPLYTPIIYKRVHLIRVPKASSTSLSVVARRLVGCEPPGPCCKYPGDPPGTCPNSHLFDCQFQNKVIGCTGHHGNNIALRSPAVKSIMIIRYPINRSISAFHYPGIHHNADCKGEKWRCFQEYLQNPRWSNVAVKMLVGDYAYADVMTCHNNSQRCSHSLELAEQNLIKLHFVGIAEMWELSLLLLHIKFPHLSPSIDEFNMIPASIRTHSTFSNNTTNIRKLTAMKLSLDHDQSLNGAQRINTDMAYLSFVEEAKARYSLDLKQQNELDIRIYEKVIEMFCKEMRLLGLWNNQFIQNYWKRKMVREYSSC